MRELSERISALTPEQRALFEARLKKKGLHTPPPSQSIPRRSAELASVCPPSVDQERLWFIEQLQPGNTAYNIFTASRIEGALNVPVMEQVINELIKRHEVLRTTFVEVDSLPMQFIAPSLEISLTPTDLRALPEEEREAEAMRLTTEDFSLPFDLERGPLVRIGLLQLRDDAFVLHVNMHHAITDRWSFAVFEEELAVLYKAFATGQPSPLPELPIQFADYAVWQRERMHGEVYQRQWAYWKEKLAGAPLVLEVPTDGPRSPFQTFRGARVYMTLPKRLLDGLRALSLREGATMYMTLMAAYKTLLYRYTAQEDLLVACSIANRNLPETQNLVGFLLNLLVLRTDLSGSPGFREVLRRERETALQAYANQDVPFGKLVQELRPKQDPSRNPVVQVAFIYLDFPESTVMEFLGMTASHIDIDNGASRFDMTLALTETSEGFTGSIEYLTELYDRPRMERMAQHFEVLLESIIADPNQGIDELPLLTEQEQRRLLVEWNETRAGYTTNAPVHELFAAQAARTPDAPALLFGNERTSYGELNARADELARRLRLAGAGPDALVGLCVERSTEMMVGLLGVLKAGAAYVPLDPAYPRERLAFMANDAGLSVMLTQSRFVEKLPPLQCPVVSLDAGDWATEVDDAAVQTPSASTVNSVAVVTPDNLAYVIYTSGSTGVPKGVMISHGSLAGRTSAMREFFGLRESDRQWQSLSLSFDASAQEIFPTLTSGATLVINTDGRYASAGETMRAGEQMGVSMWTMPAAHWHTLVDELSTGGLRVPESLRLLVVGGESPSAEKLSVFKGLLRHPVRFMNLYGPTEATILATAYGVSLASDAPDSTERIPIGRPFPNVRAYVVDAHLQPLPVALPGELLIGGEGLARGYVNRPDLTAEKFIPDPFGAEPGARLYRTGDLVRYLEDGNIEFLGRIDKQVKVRGYRIEPGEIEAVLGAHAAVKEAAVVVREDVPGNKRLVAYVAASTPQPSGDDLRGYLRERLPEYMTPSAFVLLERMPLTPNGKVDREALPAPEAATAESAVFVAPGTPVEELLASLFAKVLNVKRVSLYDNFFDAGGDSLLATQLISQVRKSFELELPLRDLFSHPTVAALAEHIEDLLIAQMEEITEEEAQQLLNNES